MTHKIMFVFFSNYHLTLLEGQGSRKMVVANVFAVIVAVVDTRMRLSEKYVVKESRKMLCTFEIGLRCEQKVFRVP